MLQSKENDDLNEMLTEAGETFQQREAEINQLKQIIEENEQRMEQQVNSLAFLLCPKSCRPGALSIRPCDYGCRSKVHCSLHSTLLLKKITQLIQLLKS